MRLIMKDKTAYVDSITLGLIPLKDFLIYARKRKGITKGALQVNSGLYHPQVHDYESGKNNSPRTMLVALDALGYDLLIVKKGK